MKRENSDNSSQVKLEKEEIATCVSCGRTFNCNALYVKMVQDGVEESLCGYCDNSHDDGGDE